MSRLRSLVKLLDGGTGEELFRRGLPDDRKTWSGLAVTNSEYHDLLIGVHRAFMEAGSSFITTNNYSITPGCGFSLEQVQDGAKEAGRLAVQARADLFPEVQIMGSLPPLVESYRPDLINDYEIGKSIYGKVATSLGPFVDGFLAETLSSIDEMRQAVDGLEAIQNTKPIFCSWTLNAQGMLRSKESVLDAVQYVLDKKQNQQAPIAAIMFNCCEPESIDKAFEQCEPFLPSLAQADIKLGAYANRLTPISDNWTLEGSEQAQPMRDDLSPETYCTKFVQQWIDKYHIQLVGGCCGITPEHIAYIRQYLLERKV